MKRINIAVLAAIVAAQIEAVEIDRVFDREVAVREVNYDESVGDRPRCHEYKLN